MDPHKEFEEEVSRNIEGLGRDTDLQAMSRVWVREIAPHKYAYNFRWLGRPVIQFPQDLVAMQEIFWRVQPDLIIETGIAHGGSLIFSASMLELIAACGGPPDARVLGVDIDIRAHNREAIEAHPMARRIDMIQGSSIAPDVVAQVRAAAANRQRVLVILDSNHTHDHVLAELQAYAPLVSVGSYCIVFDTLLEDMPAASFTDRPWGPGNSPKTAVREFLRTQAGFEVDRSIEHKLLITVAPEGYLLRTA
ncbi:MAG TPA: cephalosporin hydroxylase family protein [Ramlibacter sp.]|jgi:cephalosporin hydroxylase|nr:cephalosporin hydroxylase family protein [Ramlibacter sp.]